MTGGFYDYRHSELKFINIIRKDTQSIGEKEQELEGVKIKLQEIDQEINKLVTEQQKNDAKLPRDKSELEQIKQDINNAKKQKSSDSKALEKKRKVLGSVLSQIDQLKSSMATKKDEMGKELYKLLHKCNEQLQQFSHVNKKALDQYQNFTDQREELQKRQEELNAGDEKIKVFRGRPQMDLMLIFQHVHPSDPLFNEKMREF